MTLLTIGITAYFKSSISDLKRMVFSLFDSESTPTTIKDRQSAQTYIESVSSKSSMEDISMISVSEPVEIIVSIDRDSDTDNTIVSDITSFISSLSIPNVTFRIIKSTSNVRVAVSRNAIIQLATGTYLSFCDDDDMSININETLRIIHTSPPGIKFIEAYLLNTNKAWADLPVISLMSSCNIIVSRDFLISHNITYPPSVGNEDTIFRNDLYYALSISKGFNNAVMCFESVYLYDERSDRSIATTLSPFIDDITFYDPIMKDNRTAWKIIDLVFQHEREVYNTSSIPINGNLFRSINIIASVYHSMSVIRKYMFTHPEYFDPFIQDFIEHIKNVHQRIDFWDIDPKYHQECFESFCRFSSLSDLFHFSIFLCKRKYGHDMTDPLTDKRVLNITNVLFHHHNAFRHIKSTFGKFRYDQLDEYTYRFICFKCLQTSSDASFLRNKYKSRIDIPLLRYIKRFVDEYISRIPVSEALLFIHSSYMRKASLNTLKPDEHESIHDCLSFVGNISFTKSINESLSKVVSPSLMNIISPGLTFYAENIDVSSYLVNQKRFHGSYLDVLIGLFIAPELRKDSVDVGFVNDNIQTDEIVFVEGTREHIIKRGSFRKNVKGGHTRQMTLSGGNMNDINIHDTPLSMTSLWYIIFGLIMICVIVIVIVSISMSVNDNSTSDTVDDHQ